MISRKGGGGGQTQAGGGHWVAVLGVEEGGGGGWISTSAPLSMAWSLGLGPGSGAREEGACRRGSAACSFIFMAYFFFFFFSRCSTLEGGWGIRLQQNRACRAAYRKPLKGGWKGESPVCLSVISGGQFH